MRKSVLIIGGGMGGLFTAAILSKNGYKVTVLEKNAQIGGGLQVFSRAGEIFETGIHLVGGLRKGASLHKICSYLGIMDKIELMKTDSQCIDTLYFIKDNEEFHIPEGRDNFVNYFSALFPEENVKAYVDALYALSEEEDLYYLREYDFGKEHSEDFFLPTNQFISKYIHNHRLQKILAYMNFLYAGEIDTTPAYIHALINVLYINGEDRFVGGSHQLSKALSECISENGGEIFPNHEVKNIHCDARHITSVETSRGEHFVADYYISDIHPCALLSLLPENAFPRAYRLRLNEIPSTNSCFCLFLKFKSESFPFINHSSYLHESPESIWQLTDYEDNWPQMLFYTTPPVKTQGAYATKMTVLAPMPFSAVRQWEETKTGNHPDSYYEWKNAHAAKIIQRLSELYPDFETQISDFWTASPLTIRDYFGNKNGAIFGNKRTASNLSLSEIPVTTKIDNLLLTGQNINLHGLCGVPLTAIITAETLVGKNEIVRQINQHYGY